MTQSNVFAVRRQLRGVEYLRGEAHGARAGCNPVAFGLGGSIPSTLTIQVAQQHRGVAMLFGISFETYLAVGKAIIGIAGIILPLIGLF